MAFGFGGFIKHMNDVIRYNRDILGKRKSARELYKEEIKKRGINTTYADIELVRERVRENLKRNKTQERILKAIGILSLLILVSGSVWVVRNVDFQIKSDPKYNDNSKLYKTIIYQQPSGLDIKVDYFKHGPTASETTLKNGLKHQNSESYYETGEQLRSALYFYDTLVIEFYLFKTGDTIRNFPVIQDHELHRISLIHPKTNDKIEFDFYDGKIVPGSYHESKISNEP